LLVNQVTLRGEERGVKEASGARGGNARGPPFHAHASPSPRAHARQSDDRVSRRAGAGAGGQGEEGDRRALRVHDPKQLGGRRRPGAGRGRGSVDVVGLGGRGWKEGGTRVGPIRMAASGVRRRAPASPARLATSTANAARARAGMAAGAAEQSGERELICAGGGDRAASHCLAGPSACALPQRRPPASAPRAVGPGAPGLSAWPTARPRAGGAWTSRRAIAASGSSR